MHWHAIFAFGVCLPLAGFLLWLTAMATWPVTGESGIIPRAVAAAVTALAACVILMAGAGGLRWLSLLAAPPLLIAGRLAVPAGKHHKDAGR